MDNINEKTIDKAYDAMLNTADEILKENFDPEESLEKFKDMIESDPNLKEIADLAKEEVFDEDSTVETIVSEEGTAPEPIEAMTQYNPKTGEISVDMETINESVKKIQDRNFRSFTSNTGDEINTEVLSGLFNEEDLKEITDFVALGNLIKKYKSGKKFNVYEELPDRLKRTVDEIITSSTNDGPRAIPNNAQTRSMVAGSVLAQLAAQYDREVNATVDLDTLLSGFDKDLENMANDMSKEVGQMMLSFDDQRKAEIDAAIERCKAEGKTEAIAKFEDMKASLDNAYNLDDFAKACAHIKVKRYYFEKPQQVFTSFNAKYASHKNNINDISACPAILTRHGFSDYEAMKICLAFCRYCMNMSPDNITEHTFMYYFIRNIIAIDRLNPKGRIYESMDEKSKNFYDGFIANLRKCLSNFIK